MGGRAAGAISWPWLGSVPSWNRGLNLDLALRLQEEVKDEVQFIDRQTVENAIHQSLDHYDCFANDA